MSFPLFDHGVVALYFGKPEASEPSTEQLGRLGSDDREHRIRIDPRVKNNLPDESYNCILCNMNRNIEDEKSKKRAPTRRHLAGAAEQRMRNAPTARALKKAVHTHQCKGNTVSSTAQEPFETASLVPVAALQRGLGLGRGNRLPCAAQFDALNFSQGNGATARAGLCTVVLPASFGAHSWQLLMAHRRAQPSLYAVAMIPEAQRHKNPSGSLGSIDVMADCMGPAPSFTRARARPHQRICFESKGQASC